MTNIGKPKRKASELERMEDGLVDSLLEASGEDLRREIAESGERAEEVIAKVDATIHSAQAASARRRLELARRELAEWRAGGGPTTADREAARERLTLLRSGQRDASMMMAARKGRGLSESDEQGLVEDMAELERLERDSGKD